MTADNINVNQLESLLQTLELEIEIESLSPDEAVDRAVEALHLSVIVSDPIQEGRARFLLGVGLRRMRKLEESIAELHEALKAFSLGRVKVDSEDDVDQFPYQNNDSGIADETWERYISCLFELGNTYYEKQEFVMAQRYYDEVIEKAVGHPTLQRLRGKALVFLASAYYYLGNITKSRVTYSKALSVVREQNDPRVLIEVYLGLGWMHFEEHQLDEAIQATEHARVHSESNGLYRMSHILHNLGSMYMAEGRFDEAYEAWQNCMSDYQSNGKVHDQVSLYEELASYWIAQKDLDEAEKCCEEAVKLLNTQEHLVLRGRIYRFLGDIHQSRGNTMFAREYYRISLGALNVVGALHEIVVTQERLDKLQTQSHL